MRVQAIRPTHYANTNNKKKLTLPKTNESVSFRGPKGAVKGGLAGAAAATALGFLTGGFGFALIPLWTVGGAIGGSETENQNKESEKKDEKE